MIVKFGAGDAEHFLALRMREDRQRLQASQVSSFWGGVVPAAGDVNQRSHMHDIPQFAVLSWSRQFFLCTPVLYPIQARGTLRARGSDVLPR